MFISDVNWASHYDLLFPWHKKSVPFWGTSICVVLATHSVETWTSQVSAALSKREEATYLKARKISLCQGLFKPNIVYFSRYSRNRYFNLISQPLYNSARFLADSCSIVSKALYFRSSWKCISMTDMHKLRGNSPSKGAQAQKRRSSDSHNSRS